MPSVKLMQPQEIEVLYILPAIRKYISKCLLDQGVSQKRISKLLHVEKSTISQYIHDKRANKLEFSESTKEYIKKCSMKIQMGENMIMHTQSILRVLRDENVICKLHKKYADIPSECNMDKVRCC